MSTRNEEICELYKSGLTLEQCAQQFSISRQRVRQIVRKAGIFKGPNRDAFLGVDLTPETKASLKDLAAEKQTSMSKLASQTIEEMLAKEAK